MNRFKSKEHMVCILLSETTVQRGCLVSSRTPSKDYVQVEYRGEKYQGHRLIWEVVRGAIPKGMHLHHRCENKRCLNLEHLELMTKSAHMKLHHPRMPFCEKHEVETTWNGTRSICLACQAEKTARYRARKRVVS